MRQGQAKLICIDSENSCDKWHWKCRQHKSPTTPWMLLEWSQWKLAGFISWNLSVLLHQVGLLLIKAWQPSIGSATQITHNYKYYYNYYNYNYKSLLLLLQVCVCLSLQHRPHEKNSRCQNICQTTLCCATIITKPSLFLQQLWQIWRKSQWLFAILTIFRALPPLEAIYCISGDMANNK